MVKEIAVQIGEDSSYTLCRKPPLSAPCFRHRKQAPQGHPNHQKTRTPCMQPGHNGPTTNQHDFTDAMKAAYGEQLWLLLLHGIPYFSAQ